MVAMEQFAKDLSGSATINGAVGTENANKPGENIGTVTPLNVPTSDLASNTTPSVSNKEIRATQQAGSVVPLSTNSSPNLADTAHQLYNAFNRGLRGNDENRIIEILSKINPAEMPVINEEFKRELKAHGKTEQNLDEYAAGQLGVKDSARIQRLIGFNSTIVANDLLRALNLDLSRKSNSELVVNLLRDRTPEQMAAISSAFRDQSTKHESISESAIRNFQTNPDDGSEPRIIHAVDQVLQLVEGTVPSRVAGNLRQAIRGGDIDRFTQNLTNGNGVPLTITEYDLVDTAVRSGGEGLGIQELVENKFKHGEDRERADAAIKACQVNLMTPEASITSVDGATALTSEPQRKASEYIIKIEDGKTGLWGIAKQMLIEAGVAHPTPRDILEFDQALMELNGLDERAAKKLKVGMTLKIPDLKVS